ncbi:hypothetical protein L6471_02630 [Segatella bryantii]|nr:hypothetical protein [Segatella bryantii]UKK74621.1 hypothetical protein L6471_02630 [Segatella bryantii]
MGRIFLKMLLRYTDLGMAGVSKRASYGSINNIYLTYKRESDIAPGECRQ